MAFDPDAYLGGGTATKEFDPDAYLATDTLPEVVATQPRDYGSEIPSGAELTDIGVQGEKALPVFVRHALERASHVVPTTGEEVGEFVKSFFPPLEAYRQAKQGYDIATGTPPQEAVPGITALKDLEDIKNQYGGGSPEYQAAAGDVAGDILPQMIMAGMIGKSLQVPTPNHLVGPRPPPDLPPSPTLGPGTIAGDVSRALERRFTLQEPPPEAPPELAPAPPIEETLANIPKEPPVFNPELGPQTIPEFPMPLKTETAVSPRAAKELAKLKAHKAKVEAIGGTVSDKVTAKIAEVEQRVQPGQFAKPGYTAVDTPPEATVPTAQPEFTFGEPAYHGNTQYTLHKRGNNVEVGQINASSAGGGIRFLQDLTRWADENGITLSGDARPMRPREGIREMPQDKLKRLYRQFGFEEYGDYDRMMRVPREKPPEAPVQAQEAPPIASEAPGGVPVAEPVAATPQLEIPAEPYTPEAAAQRAAQEAAQPAPQAFSEEPHVSSIANRFTAERAAAGELGEIAPGESVNTMDLVHHGLKMSPEKVNESISRIMQGGDVPINDAAAIRGEEARLSQRSGDLSRAARANPSPEAQLAADNAFKDLTDFHNGPVAQAKRNWHHQGKLMQGEIPVDLSTLNGMREAWLKDTGKPPPAHVEPKLQKAADKLAKAIDEERAAARNGGEAIEKATRARKLPTAEEVRNSIAERMKVEPCII